MTFTRWRIHKPKNLQDVLRAIRNPGMMWSQRYTHIFSPLFFRLAGVLRVNRWFWFCCMLVCSSQDPLVKLSLEPLQKFSSLPAPRNKHRDPVLRPQDDSLGDSGSVTIGKWLSCSVCKTGASMLAACLTMQSWRQLWTERQPGCGSSAADSAAIPGLCGDGTLLVPHGLRMQR